jgi:hypothetical protein
MLINLIRIEGILYVRPKTQNKWIQEILELQQGDGSWGYFHSLSQPVKQKPITTEQALRRLRILGLTAADEPYNAPYAILKAALPVRLSYRTTLSCSRTGACSLKQCSLHG